MKKLLLTFMCLLAASLVTQAETVALTPMSALPDGVNADKTVPCSLSNPNNPGTQTIQGICDINYGGYNASAATPYLRINKSGSMTVTAAEGITITQIVFNNANTSVAAVTVDGNELKPVNKIYTWTGLLIGGTTSNSVKFVGGKDSNNKTQQIQMNYVLITYTVAPKEAQPFEPNFAADGYRMKIGQTVNFFEQWGEGKYPADIMFVPADEKVVSIDENGIMTALAAGTTNVDVEWDAVPDTWTAGSASFSVTVDPKEAYTAPEIAAQKVMVGHTLDLNALFGEAVHPDFTFTPEPETLGTVAEGVFTAGETAGEGTIKYTWTESDVWTAGEGSIAVTVEPKKDYTYEVPAQSVAANLTLNVVGLFPEGHPAITSYTVEPADLGTIADGVFTPAKEGEGTISYTWDATDELNAGSASFAITVTKALETVDVVLTVPDFYGDDTTASSYKSKTYTDPDTNIEFLGYLALNTNNSINSMQLKSSGSESGIIVTKNDKGYTFIGIKAEWKSNTTNGRQLDVYGKDVAYNGGQNKNASQLYATSGNEEQGEQLCSITYNTIQSANASKRFPFIGIRSNNGAQYINSITLTFALPEPVAPNGVTATGGDAAAPVALAETKTTITVDGVEGQTYAATVTGGEYTEATSLGDLTSATPIELSYYQANAQGDYEYVAPEINGVSFAANTLYTIDVVGVTDSFVTPPAVKTEWVDKTAEKDGYWKVTFAEGGDATIYWLDERINGGGVSGDDSGVTPPDEALRPTRAAEPGYAEYIPGQVIELSDKQDLMFYSAKGDVKSPVVKTTPNDVTTGVEEIEAADGEAVWYDLQGRRVNARELAPGLYIKVQGKKALKVLVK